MRDRRTDRQRNAALPGDEIVRNSSADFLTNLWPASAPRRGGASPVNDPWSRLGLDLGSCGSLLRSRHPSLEHRNENRETREHSPLVRGLSLESVYSNLSYHRQMNQNTRFDPSFFPNPSNFLDVSYQHTSPETVKQTWSTGDSDIFSPVRNQPNYSPFRVDNRNRDDIMPTLQDHDPPVQLNLRLDRQPSFEHWARNGRDFNRNDNFCDFGHDENDWGKSKNDQLVRSPVSEKHDPGRHFSENDDLKTRIKKLVHGKDYHTLNNSETLTKSNSFPYPREEQHSPSPDIDHQHDQWARTQSPTKLSLAWSPLKFLDNDPLIGAPLVSTPPSSRNQWEGAVDSILRDSRRTSSPNGEDSSPGYADGNESSLFQRTLTFRRAARPRFSSDVRQHGSSSGPRRDFNRNDNFCDFGHDENDWGKSKNDQLVRSPVSEKHDPGRHFSENDDLKTRIKKLVHGKDYHTLNNSETLTKSNSFPYPREEQHSPSPDIDHQHDQWARTQSPTKLSLAWSPLKFLDNDPLIGAPLVSTPPSSRNQWEGAVDSILRDSRRTSSPNGEDSSPGYADGNESSLFQRTLTFRRAARPRFSSDVRQHGSSSGPRSPGDFRRQSPGIFNHENPTPVRKRDRPRFLSDNTEAIPAVTSSNHERNDIDNALFAEFHAPFNGSLFDRNSRRTASARIYSHRALPHTSTSSRQETLNKSYSHDPLAWNPNEHENLDKDIRSLTLRLKKSLDSLYHPQDDLDNREDATLIFEEQGRPTSPRFNINSWSPNNADVPRYKNRIKACQSSPVIFSGSHTSEKDPVELKFANGFHTLQINRNKGPPEELAKLGPNRIKGSDFGAGRFRCTPVHEERGKTVYLDCPDSDSSDPSEEKVATIITFKSVSAA